VNKIKNSLIYTFAIIGALAVTYAGWTVYQHYAAQEQARAFFSAPPSAGTPDFMHAKPHPPPQP
jgi:hypothetical protein